LERKRKNLFCFKGHFNESRGGGKKGKRAKKARRGRGTWERENRKHEVITKTLTGLLTSRAKPEASGGRGPGKI